MPQTTSIELHVDGVPQTKGSWRVGMRRGRPFLIADNDAEPTWAQLVAWSARAKQRNAIDPDRRRYAVRLEFTLPPVTGRGRKNRRDLDKLMRSILDALTGIIWLDDEQVEDAHLSKRVGDSPGVVILIEAKGT